MAESGIDSDNPVHWLEFLAGQADGVRVGSATASCCASARDVAGTRQLIVKLVGTGRPSPTGVKPLVEVRGDDRGVYFEDSHRWDP